MMIIRLQVLIIFCLSILYLSVIVMVLNPNTSEDYRSYYIERITDDWRPIRYSATLSDGFDFSKPGLPSFIRFTSGISGHEVWGRWTDAKLRQSALIKYENAFSGEVCLAVKLSPASKQIGKPAIIRAGTIIKSFTTEATTPRWYYFDLYISQPTDSIEIEATTNERAGKKDERILGLGLYRLVVIPGSCDDLRIIDAENANALSE